MDRAGEWKAKYERLQRLAWQRYRKVVDDLGPYVWQRWAALGVFALLYFWRIAAVHGFYLITYALGIFLLNRVLLFLSPKIDPQEEQSLPLSNSLDEDFRPFIRALPEKTFWLQATAAFTAAFLATFVRFLNVPVFWPILLVYFICLSSLNTGQICPCFLTCCWTPHGGGVGFLFVLKNSSDVRDHEEADRAHDQVQVPPMGVRQEKVRAPARAKAVRGLSKPLRGAKASAMQPPRHATPKSTHAPAER